MYVFAILIQIMSKENTRNTLIFWSIYLPPAEITPKSYGWVTPVARIKITCKNDMARSTHEHAQLWDRWLKSKLENK